MKNSTQDINDKVNKRNFINLTRILMPKLLFSMNAAGITLDHIRFNRSILNLQSRRNTLLQRIQKDNTPTISLKN